MYKAIVTNLEHWMLYKHKVGDIIHFADNKIYAYKKNVQILEHYRRVLKNKGICSKCKQQITEHEIVQVWDSPKK